MGNTGSAGGMEDANKFGKSPANQRRDQQRMARFMQKKMEIPGIGAR